MKQKQNEIFIYFIYYKHNYVGSLMTIWRVYSAQKNSQETQNVGTLTCYGYGYGYLMVVLVKCCNSIKSNYSDKQNDILNYPFVPFYVNISSCS